MNDRSKHLFMKYLFKCFTLLALSFQSIYANQEESSLRNILFNNYNPKVRPVENIDDTIKDKLTALNCYKSQIKDNKSRSLKSVKALANFRGSQNGCDFAEGLKLIRAIV